MCDQPATTAPSGGDIVPRCRHGRILLGCADDTCPEQNAYLEIQHAAFAAHQAQMLENLRAGSQASDAAVRWDGQRWVSNLNGWVYRKDAGRHGTGALFPVPAAMSDNEFTAQLDERYGPGQW